MFLKDASGLLTPERVATLVPALKAALGTRPLQIHTHCNSGLAPYVVLQAVEHGVDVVHTATSTLANGVSHSPTERVAANLRRRGHDVRIDLAPVREVAERLAYIAEKEGKPVGTPNEYDEFHFLHQCPGGMVSNLAFQLESMGLKGRLDEILEEAWHVREDLGYPIVVSPFAQYIVTQAVLNVMGRDQGASALRHGARRGAPLRARRLRRDRRRRSIPTSTTRSRAAPSRSRSDPARWCRRRSTASGRRADRSPPTTICCSRPSTTTRSTAP